MATVTETLDLPGSGTPSNVTVSIELVGTGGFRQESWVTADGTVVVGKLQPTLTAGAWSAVLVANDSLTPSGTVYRRTIDGRGFGHIDYFEVPIGSGSHTLFSLLTDVPGAIEQTALAAEAATRAAADTALDGRLDTAETTLSGLGSVATLDTGTAAGEVRTNSQNDGTYLAQRVAAPVGFPAFVHLPEPKVYRLGGGRFGVDLDLSALLPSGGSTYYIDRAGSSGNTGLTPASPWNIATAIAAVNAGAGGDTIALLPGEFQTTTWATLTKSCNVVAYQPGARITQWVSSGLTWLAASGVAGADDTIYSTAKLDTNGVFDLANLNAWTDRTGRTHRDFTQYRNMGTGADEAAALALITADGQFAKDGTKIYVRPIGAMDLTNASVRGNVRLRQANTVGITASGAGVVVYVRGIDFEGHSTFGAAADAVLIGEDCTLKYSANDATTHQGGHAIHIRVVASGNGRDGFNYHDAAGNNSEFMEIDCVSGYNGLLDVVNDNNNASTAHETCRGIRVGGPYLRSTGPTIADVNAAKTWNLGVDARDSLAVTAANRHNWRVDTTAEQWLDECSSDGQNLNAAALTGLGYTAGVVAGTGTGYTFKASTAATSKIHLSGYQGAARPVAIDTSNVGVIDYYTPA